MAPAASTQEPLDVDLAEFGRFNIMLGKPAVVRRGVHRLDVHDGGDELLTNQQIDEGTKMLRDWTGGAAHERGGESLADGRSKGALLQSCRA